MLPLAGAVRMPRVPVRTWGLGSLPGEQQRPRQKLFGKGLCLRVWNLTWAHFASKSGNFFDTLLKSSAAWRLVPKPSATQDGLEPRLAAARVRSICTESQMYNCTCPRSFGPGKRPHRKERVAHTHDCNAQFLKQNACHKSCSRGCPPPFLDHRASTRKMIRQKPAPARRRSTRT